MFARILALAALAVTAPALAGGAPKVAVSYADLNLATDSGAQQLERRVKSAVKAVCAVHGTRDLRSLTNARDCKRAATAAAASKLQVAVNAARQPQQYAASTVAVPNAARD